MKPRNHVYPHEGENVVLIDSETVRVARDGELGYGRIMKPAWARGAAIPEFTDADYEAWTQPGMVSVQPHVARHYCRILFRLAPEMYNPIVDHDSGDEDHQAR